MPAQSTALRQIKSETSQEMPSQSRSTEKIFKYVPLDQINDYAVLGWKIHVASLVDTHHGHYSTLGEWIGEGEPVYP